MLLSVSLSSHLPFLYLQYANKVASYWLEQRWANHSLRASPAHHMMFVKFYWNSYTRSHIFYCCFQTPVAELWLRPDAHKA